MASTSFVFQWRATFSSSGSSGLGALISAWMLQHVGRARQGQGGNQAVRGGDGAAAALTARVCGAASAANEALGAAPATLARHPRRPHPRQTPPNSYPHVLSRLLANETKRRPQLPRLRAAPEQHCADLQRGAPLVLQDVQADAAQLVDVGVVDLGEEAHLQAGQRCGSAGPVLRTAAGHMQCKARWGHKTAHHLPLRRRTLGAAMG